MSQTVDRAIKDQLLEELESDKIIILTGPRQSGKTTLLRALADELKAKNEQVYFYNFDRMADMDFFSKQQKVEAFLNIRSIKSKLYVFIDEVQRKKDAGNFFKYFYDAGLNVKFIFSGSSSVELTDTFGDALTGRKRLFTLFPLSLREIGKSILAEEFEYAEMGEPIAVEKLGVAIEEGMIWGSYPEVYGKKSESAKLRALEELYESYVQKDVKDLLRVKNIAGFNMLVKILAHNVSQPVVVEDIVRQTGLHANTVNSYLDILEGTLIIGRTDNYNPNFDDKLPKSKRYYFIDNGMRNFALAQMQSGFRTDYRSLAVNLVYTELRKYIEYNGVGAEIYHYQTYSDNNVDFIVKPKRSEQILPVVVRYPEDNLKLGKKIHEYINTNEPKQLFVVTKELVDETVIKNCQIRFLPLTELVATLGKLL